MKNKVLFPCAECGGDVVMLGGPGRVEAYRVGVFLPVPPDFPLRTCTECGETYLSVGEGEKLAKRQAPLYDAWLRDRAASLLEVLRARHGVTLRRLEFACGVTPTYFSHLAKRRRKPSLTIVRLLEAYAAAPHELARHLSGRPSRDAAVSAEALRGPAASTVAAGRWLVAPDPYVQSVRSEGLLEPAAASNDYRAA